MEVYQQTSKPVLQAKSEFCLQGGPNQGKAFEKLCERVESSTQSVHTALQEVNNADLLQKKD